MANIAAANANRFIMFLDSLQVQRSEFGNPIQLIFSDFVSSDLVEFMVQISSWGRELDCTPEVSACALPKAWATATSFDSSIRWVPPLLFCGTYLSVYGHRCAHPNIRTKEMRRVE
jgi:hypothetical protein